MGFKLSEFLRLYKQGNSEFEGAYLRLPRGWCNLSRHILYKDFSSRSRAFCQYRSLKQTVRYCAKKGYKIKERVTKARTNKDE